MKMVDVGVAPPCRNSLLSGGVTHLKKIQFKSALPRSTLGIPRGGRAIEPRMITKTEARMANPSTYSSRISTDIPLYEVPGASFDQYLEDKPRVFKAIFPDKRRSQQLNEEEWRVHMLPIEFLFIKVFPVVDMRLRCKSSAIEYPPGVPRDISKLLELDIIRWDLQGLDEVLKPSQFNLGVKGALYPDRRGPRSRLKGQLQMTISFDLPPILSLVPEDIRRQVAESVLKRLVENMKDQVNNSLVADYSQFKRQRPKTLTVERLSP